MTATPEVVAEIKGHYQAGRGSIQDYARMYHLPVEEVLEIVGETDLMQVQIIGDQIDINDVGKQNAHVINPPSDIDVPFSLN